MTNKVILIDWNIFVFRSIFSWRLNKAVPPTYTALSMLLSTLKKIGCHPEDTIILAIDSPKGSWRKQVDVQYKANRKEARAKYEDIDWSAMFDGFKVFLSKLEASTPFISIEIPFHEADDIISASCRYYKDPIVIVSSDSDYEQLAHYPHVRLYTPVAKRYKEVKNPLNILAKKIEMEKTDNLITPIQTEADYQRRLLIVDLLHLPEEVEREVVNRLSTLEYHTYDLDKLPFPSLKNRFLDIYCEGEPEKKKRKKKKLKQLTLT